MVLDHRNTGHMVETHVGWDASPPHGTNHTFIYPLIDVVLGNRRKTDNVEWSHREKEKAQQVTCAHVQTKNPDWVAAMIPFVLPVHREMSLIGTLLIAIKQNITAGAEEVLAPEEQKRDPAAAVYQD